jgi:hypothetical protein
MKFVAGLIGGLILAVLATTVVGLAGAASGGGAGSGGVFLGAWAIALVIALTAPRVGKAWRRLLIISGLMAFMLPLSGIIFTGSYVATKVDHTSAHAAAEAAGATIGGALVSGALGFIGFFLGVILIIVGLLTGRDKQVVYVQAPPTAIDK